MAQTYEILDRDITGTRRFSARKTYVVTTDVRVRKDAKLFIEDGTTILIENGEKADTPLLRAALVFEQGSALHAKRLYVKACDASHRQCRVADNGGLWFLGNFNDATKDTVKVVADRKKPTSSFKADLIAAYYLGRKDPLKETSRTRAVEDDIDGFSVLGVGPDEWIVAEVRSFHSADDGFDVTNSHLRLDRIRIVAPTEDGINLSSSRLEVKRSLFVDVTKTDVLDRDIFDFEADDGASYLEIAQHCHIDIRGVFGDQLVLSARDLPKPNNNPEARYKFKGVARKAAALIYTINQD